MPGSNVKHDLHEGRYTYSSTHHSHICFQEGMIGPAHPHETAQEGHCPAYENRRTQDGHNMHGSSHLLACWLLAPQKRITERSRAVAGYPGRLQKQNSKSNALGGLPRVCCSFKFKAPRGVRYCGGVFPVFTVCPVGCTSHQRCT